MKKNPLVFVKLFLMQLNMQIESISLSIKN